MCYNKDAQEVPLPPTPYIISRFLRKKPLPHSGFLLFYTTKALARTNKGLMCPQGTMSYNVPVNGFVIIIITLFVVFVKSVLYICIIIQNRFVYFV